MFPKYNFYSNLFYYNKSTYLGIIESEWVRSGGSITPSKELIFKFMLKVGWDQNKENLTALLHYQTKGFLHMYAFGTTEFLNHLILHAFPL